MSNNAPEISDYEEAADEDFGLEQDMRDAANNTLEKIFNGGSDE